MKLWDVSLATGKLDSEVKARIIGVQNQMCEFQFFYGLNLSQRLFAITDNLSKTLQKESMSALSGLHLAELTVKTYQKMRSDEEAELFFKTVSKKALDYPFINKAALPRKRKKPNYRSLDGCFQVEGLQLATIHLFISSKFSRKKPPMIDSIFNKVASWRFQHK